MVPRTTPEDPLRSWWSYLPDEAAGGEELGGEVDGEELEVPELLAAVGLHVE